ncbi:hypothetical protein MKX01_031234 [Papaver californicum]|nr:hypothetical protein MKX01_031234 [Papaver californicum]
MRKKVKRKILHTDLKGVVENQWAPLVKMWHSKKNKGLAAKNRENRTKQTVPHTGGSKPHMEYAKKMEADTGIFPERHDIFRVTRTKRRKTSDPNEEVMDPVDVELYGRMVAIHNQANQPGSEVVLGGRKYAFAAVMGQDRRGRVRCFGSTVKPKQFWGESSSSNRVAELREENVILKRKVAELEAQVAVLPPNRNNEGLEDM